MDLVPTEKCLSGISQRGLGPAGGSEFPLGGNPSALRCDCWPFAARLSCQGIPFNKAFKFDYLRVEFLEPLKLLDPADQRKATDLLNPHCFVQPIRRFPSTENRNIRFLFRNGSCARAWRVPR